MTTASKISVLSDGQAASDVLLLGAAGNSGRLIAAELAVRGLSVRLAGRRRGPLGDLARVLAADGAATQVHTVDVSDAASLADAIAGVGVVLSSIGPFARQAGPVIDACLTAGVSYVDIANEWPAVRGLLDRDEQARVHKVALVTGAGFGPAATETLVLRLAGQVGTPPAGVRVAAAAGVTRRSDGVRQTIQEAISQGAITYRGGQVVREACGSGATVLTLAALNGRCCLGRSVTSRQPGLPAAPQTSWHTSQTRPRPAVADPALTPGPRSPPPTGTLL